MKRMLLGASLLLLEGAAVLGDNVVRISDADQLIEFSNNVNNGANYSGTTVLLDSDIDFTGKTSFEPIGKDENNYFTGIFNGQGHTFSNLVTNSSTYSGLFGYSHGSTTIRNVIIDDSCTLSGHRVSSSDVYVGEIIAYCYGYNGEVTVENCVNMGNITFNGDTTTTYYTELYIGGICGYAYGYIYTSFIKFCANYGSISGFWRLSSPYFGGIAGYIEKHTFLIVSITEI